VVLAGGWSRATGPACGDVEASSAGGGVSASENTSSKATGVLVALGVTGPLRFMAIGLPVSAAASGR
jgi:hypothetical protein